jgi:hypothetical protein
MVTPSNMRAERIRHRRPRRRRGAILKNIPGRNYQVAGHTGNIPIKSRRFPDLGRSEIVLPRRATHIVAAPAEGADAAPLINRRGQFIFLTRLAGLEQLSIWYD